MAKIPVHRGKKRAASTPKHNNTDGQTGAISKNMKAVITGGGDIKSRPSTPRYQKTQNAKTTSGSVKRKPLNLKSKEINAGLNTHEQMMSPTAVHGKIKQMLTRQSRGSQPSNTVSNLRKYITKNSKRGM